VRAPSEQKLIGRSSVVVAERGISGVAAGELNRASSRLQPRPRGARGEVASRAMKRLAVPLASVALATLATPALAVQELGFNVHQSVDVGLDATHDAGLGWVRIDLDWLDAEPAQGALDFTLFDTIVDQARARGLEVLATVAYTPAWASSGDTKADGSNNDVPVAGAYAAFVTQVVQHFQGRVDHYELWNEPNLGVFFEGTPDDYVARVLVPGADAVHAACPSCKVVGPALASVGGQYDVWLDAALGAAKDKIDVVSGHAYAGFPDMGAGGTSDDFFHKIEKHRVVKIGDTVVYEGPRAFKEVMDAHGATQPFWLTETGIEAALGDAPALEKQRTFARHVLEAMLPRPWWTTTIFYEAFDEPAGGYHFGAVVHDGTPPHGYTPKPMFDLIRFARAAQPRFGGNVGDCADGLDEDGDGLIDWPSDPDCDSKTDSTEGILSRGVGGSGGGGAGGAGGAGGGAGDGGAKPVEKSGCACEASVDPTGRPGVAVVLGAALLLTRRARRRGRRGAVARASATRGTSEDAPVLFVAGKKKRALAGKAR
jgi:hypothetical protein